MAVTFDPDPITDEELDAGADQAGPRPVVGRMVSFRYLRLALRRHRKVWLGLAVLGLLGGIAFHVAVPVKYSATATLYISSPSGANSTVASANNLAMLETGAVGQRAIDALHLHGVTPAQLLGKVPGTAVSDNVINVTIAGSTEAEAVQRTNAVADAYLSFRAEQFEDQNNSVVQAANDQIARLEQQIASLTAQINAAGTGSGAQGVSSLISERAAATAQVTSLQQSIDTDNLDTLSLTKGSRVITGATQVNTSKKKLLVLDGLTGLVVGLALGLGIVVLQAVLSERLRRREEVAAVLGVPLGVTIGPVGRRRFRRRRLTIRQMVEAPDQRLLTLVRFLRARLGTGEARPAVMVVPVDEPEVPAAALIALAGALSASGRTVSLVDATKDRALAAALGETDPGRYDAWVGNCPPVVLQVVPQPWESGLDETGAAHPTSVDVDLELVLATVDPAVGAWHLRSWAHEAVVSVTAGRSSAQQIDATAELLDAADITVATAVLLDADEDDETVGLPDPGGPAFRHRLPPVEADAALLA
jgi:capsular polysaccharide biosynthesis protein